MSWIKAADGVSADCRRMKSILVLAGGGETDGVVFDTALSTARSVGAHLDFLHVHLSAGDAAVYSPHVDFAMGKGLEKALALLTKEAADRATTSLRDFEQLCSREALPIVDMPPARSDGTVTASWREIRTEAIPAMMAAARHRDLVVIGRFSRSNGLPPQLVEDLLLESGRPILVAPPISRPDRSGVAVVGWKETPASARALTAALPLLATCERVVVVAVDEGSSAGSFDDVCEVGRGLAWHGINVDVKWLPMPQHSAAELLHAIAGEFDADYLVMGGYGRGRFRETIFGGCTRHFLEAADRPVLLMH
ncbi:MAG: universal stress protein [Alphaproteobacteria bacterium]|nr:universal stress protein [Alphaproteobacteria bacterium]